MSEATFIGFMVSALVVLVGLFISLATPIIKLNKTIQRLNDTIDAIKADMEQRKEQLQKLHNELDKHSRWLLIDKKRLDNQSMRLSKLDGEVGFSDSESRGD